MKSEDMVFVWLILTVVLLIIEICTVSLTTIWFAGGSIIALIAAKLGAPIVVQCILFVVVSLVVLFLLRPSVVKKFNKDRLKTNVSALIGKDAKVIEDIDNNEMTGKVLINSMEWTARAAKDDMIIKAGSKAKIVDIKGVKLILSNVKEEEK